MVTIRPLTTGDIGQAIQLSRAERWNQTELEWEFLVNDTRNRCIAAVDGNEIVGTAAAINYDNRIFWIGMVIVRLDYRGNGLGRRLMEEIIQQLPTGCTVKLDATPAGQFVYQKLNFFEECVIHRMMLNPVSQNQAISENTFSETPVTMNDIPEIVELDARIFGTKRKQLIEFLFANFPEHAWKIRREGRITGFALGRNGSHSIQIGPVVAQSTSDAENPIKKALFSLEGTAVIIDIYKDKTELMKLLETIGFVRQRDFIRMYLNENRSPGIKQQEFLICGPEFG